MVKKDLNEFVEVIQGDTSQTMNETAVKLKEDVEVILSSLTVFKSHWEEMRLLFFSCENYFGSPLYSLNFSRYSEARKI